MADDYQNNSSTTGLVVVGGVTNGVLETAGDSDWFAVNVVAGYNYQFDLAALPGFTNPASLNEALLDANGRILAGGNVNSTNKSFYFTPSASETDYVSVSSRAGIGSGAYTVTTSAADDYPSNTSTPGRIAPGSIAGRLEGVNDADWFAVTVRAGFNYQFSINAGVGTTNPTSLDVSLVNTTGTYLAGGSTINSAIKTFSYTPTASGTDYVIASSNTVSSVGTYTVTESALDDYAANSTTTGSLAIGGSTNGNLEGANDTDWFAVTLTAGSTYQFSLSAAAGFVGPTNLDEGLLNANGNTVAGGGRTDKSISYTPTASGTYYLSVSSADGASTGTYTLTSNGGNGSGSAGGTATPSVPVYRFFDTHTGTQFLTSSASERDTVVNTRPDLRNEGVGLNAAPSTDPNASPVFRFFDTVFGTHFFTSSAAERDTIISTRSDLTFEGVGFNEYANPQANTSAVYRFFDTHAGTHFYTGSETERASILATRPDLTPEGIAFYAPT